MKKPLIGVVPLVDSEKASYWMLPGYMKGIEEAGGVPLMLPLTKDKEIIKLLSQKLDGFLLTGGQDVSPLLYGEKISPKCGEACAERDEMEAYLLKLLISADKPILGICRGIQFLNVYLGGTLYQDLPTEYESKVLHHMLPPYHRAVHTVRLLPDAPLYSLLEKPALGVNSYHHQAVKELAPPLKAMAYSEDNLVEAVYMPQKCFIWAVQWHPELSYKVDESSRKILRELVLKAE